MVTLREARALNFEERFAATSYCVRATTFEVLTLRNEYLEEVSWEDISDGWLVPTGYLDKEQKQPICISTWWVVIEGHLVLFYDIVSRFSDTDIVEAWFTANCPSYAALRRTNAMNFARCIDHLKSFCSPDLENCKKNAEEALGALERFFQLNYKGPVQNPDQMEILQGVAEAQQHLRMALAEINALRGNYQRRVL